MADWQFWSLLIAIFANGYFMERRIEAVMKQNAILISKLVL